MQVQGKTERELDYHIDILALFSYITFYIPIVAEYSAILRLT